MDDLASLLANSNAPREPAEIRAIKDYMKASHNVEVAVSTSHTGLSITVPNGMLATTLRMELPALRSTCDIPAKTKIFIRIGQS